MDAEQSQMVDISKTGPYRWGSQKGYVVLGGRKVNVKHPRVRNRQKKEIKLKSYQGFQKKTKMQEAAFRDLIRGITTRSYQEGIRGLLGHYGVQSSSISRHFVEKTQVDLKRLLERDLHGWDLGVIYIDGIHYAQTLLVVAMGVDRFGRKHVLGLWQGATENAQVCGELLDDLIERGLDPEDDYLSLMEGRASGARWISGLGKRPGSRDVMSTRNEM